MATLGARRHPSRRALRALLRMRIVTPRTTEASGQELFGDGAAEAVVVVDEFVDELVQALLEDLLHAAVLQPGADGAGLALRRPLPPIGAGDPVEILHQVVVAAR